MKIVTIALVLALTGCATGTPLGDFQTQVSNGIGQVLSPVNAGWNCYNSFANKCGTQFGLGTSPVQ